MRPEVNGVPLEMEIDTGTSLSIMSEQTKRQKLPNLKAKPSSVVLKNYTGEQLTVLGQMEVDVYYKGQEARLQIHIVDSTGPILLGRDWLEWLKLDWHDIK